VGPFLPALLALLTLILVSPCIAAPSPADLDALVVLNSIGGFGDTGKIEASRNIVAPGNKLGFSLKVIWEEHKGGPGYWSIRMGFPPGVHIQDYDTFACDLYVESAEGGANATIYLVQSDEDRWICRGGPLSDAPAGKWQHIEIKRDKMTPWLLGNGKLEWDRVGSWAIETSRGKGVFYVDNPCLLGPGGKRVDLITTADDGAVVDPAWKEPLRIPPPGRVYFPGLSRQNLMDAGTPAKWVKLLGDVCTSAYGAPAVHDLRQAGMDVFFYSAFADGFTRYLTRRQAWDMNAAGGTPNTTPFFEKWYNGYHCLAYGHPAVMEAGKQRVDALVKSGIGAWVIVDYTFPWSDGPFGYSEANVAAYRRDLTGTDEGLHIRDAGKETVIRFADYFRGYNGFTPKLSDLALGSWQEFTPPKGEAKTVTDRARWETFLYLRSYEWLKLPDRIGRYYQSKGGHGIWVIPNPEDSWGSSDYMYLTRIAGARNLFPEWFGNAGFIAEGAYAGVPYLREQADRGGSRLSVLFETGAGGHAQPYWDWRIAYTASYTLTAISRGEDLDNDFLDESTYETQSDPKNAAQFNRFRDGVSKALGFQQARAEKPRRPAAPILCIGERPPARACNSIFFGVGGSPYSFAPALSRSHLLFDLRDSFELEKAINRYDVVAYSPMSPRVGDAARLQQWLSATPGRTLVTHTFVPTRDATDFLGTDRSAAFGAHATSAAFGLGEVTSTGVSRCKITAAALGWQDLFPIGEDIELPSPLTKCSTGEALVSTDAGPLISRVKVGASQVIYLHFTGEDGLKQPVLGLNMRAMTAIARAATDTAKAKLAPLCDPDPDTLLQVFDVPGGKFAVLWDAPTLNKWEFKYEPGIPPLKYEAPGVDRALRLPVAGQSALVYDFWQDRLQAVSPQDGRVALPIKGTICGLYYYGPDSPALRATIAAAQRTRRQMDELKFSMP
jgi:hypothetical protein